MEFEGREIHFGEIDSRSNRIANRLLAEGLEPGDRVAVYLKNCMELIEIFIACAKAGFIFTPMNILYREGEIGHIVRDAEPRVLFAHRESNEILAGVMASNPKLILWRVEDLPALLKECSDAATPAVATTDTVAALVYTSGTTGRPKGAMLSHGNFVANTQNLIESWRMTSADRLLLPLPLFH